MIDTMFAFCVQVLTHLAQVLGMTYEEVNVWFFCVVWPAFTVLLIAVIAWQRRKLRLLTGLNEFPMKRS